MQALQSPNFRRFFLSHLVSQQGFWIFRLALGWLAWTHSESALWTAILMFLPNLPTLLFSIPLGVFLDRADPKKLLRYTSLGMAGSFALLAAIETLGLTSLTTLIIAALAQGSVSLVAIPVRLSFTPTLVEPRLLASAVGLNSMGFNTARLVGPALGGFMLVTVGPGISLWVAALAPLPMFFALPWVKRHTPWVKPERKNYGSDFRAGFSYMISDALIWTPFLIIFTCSMTARGLFDLLPYFADGLYQTGASGLSIMTAMTGVGSILAGLVLSRFDSQPKTLLRYALIASSSLMVLTFVQSLAFTYWQSLIIFGFMSFCATSTAVSCMSLIQIQSPQHLRARLMSIWTVLSIASMSVGALVAGSLISAFGLALSLSLMSGLGALVLISCLKSPARKQTLEPGLNHK